MDRESEMAAVRRAYAKQILAAAGVAAPRLEAAFAAVRREDFAGPGPWQILRWGTAYLRTPSADPVYLYTNDLVALVPERRLNNGQPSLHAHLLSQAGPAEGEHAVHIGTGAGYYTALMAELVGPSGRVTGIEFDPDLAARARANLANRTNVDILIGDGARVPFDEADLIYVNAGATQPAPSWLDRLKDGGRLILPLTTAGAFGAPAAALTPAEMVRHGAVFRIARTGDEFHARWISPVAIFPCEGNRDEAAEQALAAAFATGRFGEVMRLHRGEVPPPEQCWVRGPDWCLAYR